MCICNYLIRGLEHFKNWIGCNKSHNRYDNRRYHGKRKTVAYGFAEIGTIVRAVVLADHDACAGRYAHQQYQQKIYYRSGSTHGGQRIIAHVLPNDYRVHGRVKLLGKIADQQWH